MKRAGRALRAGMLPVEQGKGLASGIFFHREVMAAAAAPDLDERLIALGLFGTADRVLSGLDRVMVDFGDHIAFPQDPLRTPENSAALR